MTPTNAMRLLAAALAATASIVIAGCGSDDDGDSTISDARAELIAEADALCAQSSKEIDAAVQKRLRQIGDDDLENKDLVAIFSEITLPALEDLYTQLGELQPAPEDAEQYEQIIDAAEKAVRESEADPEKLVVLSGDETPFDEPNRLQREFGFKVCGGGGTS